MVDVPKCFEISLQLASLLEVSPFANFWQTVSRSQPKLRFYLKILDSNGNHFTTHYTVSAAFENVA